MIHTIKHLAIFSFAALLAACGAEGVNTNVSSISTALTATVATQTTDTTVVGTSPKRDLLANLALTYPGGVLPVERAAEAAVQLAQNPAALKFTATAAETTSSPASSPAGFTPQAAFTYTVGLSSPVQRAQNTTLFGSYFFSIYPSEMTNALATNPTWNLEGTAFHASLGINPGLAPVYRFRNLINGSYLYTISDSEKNDIIANYGAYFTLEGPAWYASPTAATGFTPLYRFRNVTNGTYLFSAYESEKNNIVANYAGIFLLEGISYYVRLTPPLEMSLLAGSGAAGNVNGTGAAASFNRPEGMALDNAGNLYAADGDNNAIRKITPSGVVTTFAGSATGVAGSTNGTGTAAMFSNPIGIVYLPISNVLMVTDGSNHTIRQITMAGVVSTLAGLAGTSGSSDGTFAAARFNGPRGIAVNPAENILVVADRGNHTIRQISIAGTVSTLAGTAGMLGSANGTGAAARFSLPRGVAFDGSGNVYVTDFNNQVVRKITSAGVVTTLAGVAGSAGTADGTGNAAKFNGPYSIASDGATNLYVVDTYSSTVRKVTTAGVVTTVVGTGTAGTFVPGLLPNVISALPNGIAIGGGKTNISMTNNQILEINGVP